MFCIKCIFLSQLVYFWCVSSSLSLFCCFLETRIINKFATNLITDLIFSILVMGLKDEGGKKTQKARRDSGGQKKIPSLIIKMLIYIMMVAAAGMGRAGLRLG